MLRKFGRSHVRRGQGVFIFRTLVDRGGGGGGGGPILDNFVWTS